MNSLVVLWIVLPINVLALFSVLNCICLQSIAFNFLFLESSYALLAHIFANTTEMHFHDLKFFCPPCIVKFNVWPYVFFWSCLVFLFDHYEIYLLFFFFVMSLCIAVRGASLLYKGTTEFYYEGLDNASDVRVVSSTLSALFSYSSSSSQLEADRELAVLLARWRLRDCKSSNQL